MPLLPASNGGSEKKQRHSDHLSQAEVEGSLATPYRVRCTFDPPGQTTATCACPYEWGGWCKHVDAIAALKQSAPDALVEQVAEAAIATRPEWVIQMCRERAEAITDTGKAQHYATAIEWLRKVRAASGAMPAAPCERISCHAVI